MRGVRRQRHSGFDARPASVLVLAVGLVLGPGRAATAAPPTEVEVLRWTSPVPASDEDGEGAPDEARRAWRALGRSLFHDARLSAGPGDCSRCHPLDGRPGPDGTPSVVDVRLRARLGRAGEDRGLEVFLGSEGPSLHGGADWDEIERVLAEHPSFVLRVRALGASPDRAAVVRALATFLSGLRGPDSAFDRFLLGRAPLPAEAARGLEQLVGLGCVRCHQGVALGANLVVDTEAGRRRVPSLRSLGASIPAARLAAEVERRTGRRPAPATTAALAALLATLEAPPPRLQP